MTENNRLSQGRNRQSRHDIERLFSEVRLYVWIGGALVGIVFTIIQLKDIPLPAWLNQTSQDDVQAIVLWIYYLCWIGGTSFDAYYQKWVYLVSPHRINVRLQSVMLVFVLVLVAIIFVYVRRNEKLFSTALGVFLILNIVAWLYILSIVNPIIRASRDVYLQERDYIGLEQLRIIEHHMAGSWQVWRFVGMMLIIFSLNIISFMPEAREYISAQVNIFIPSLRQDAISSLLPVILFTLFVGFAEGVIWFMRMRTSISIHAIEALEHQYNLTLRSHEAQKY